MPTRHKTRVDESLEEKVGRLSAIVERQQQQLDELRRNLNPYPHPDPAHAGNPATLTSMAPPQAGEGEFRESPRAATSRRELLRLAGAAEGGAAPEEGRLSRPTLV